MWEDFTRHVAPRGRLRLDVRTPTGVWAHRYDRESTIGAHPPAGPFAMYLADHTGFRFLAFDLDAGKTTTEQLQQDLLYLCHALDEAGLVFLIAASGPSGGRHVWVPVNDPSGQGLHAHTVRGIARAAQHHCPSLDISALLNPSHGCLRPPGAPHRHGGHSQLLFPTFPDIAEAYCSAANHLTKFDTLAQKLGPPPPEEDEVLGGGLIDTHTWRLIGRKRPLPQSTAALLEQTPIDASAHLARIFTGLALARWSRADVIDLVEHHPHAPGLEHLRTQGTNGAGRRRRGPSEQRAVLHRQWARIVHFASRAPRREQTTHDTPEVKALVERVAHIYATTRQGSWWRPQAGPSDRKALLYVAAMALTALTDTVEVDCRRLADATGMTPSTASRALRRLILDGRLTLTQPGEGQRAHSYQLVCPSSWKVTQVRDALTQGGTQAIPAPEPTTREALLDGLTRRLDHAAHDVWSTTRNARGLGRHRELTAAALIDGPDALTLADIATYTGYTPTRTLAHLHVLTRYGIIQPGNRYSPRPYDPHALATRLGTQGVRTRRLRRYQAERKAWAAWCEELARLRAPASLARSSRPRYPRTHQGSPDHRAVRCRAYQALAPTR